MTFTEVNCQGNVGRFYAPESLGHKAEFLKSEMQDRNGINDDIESIMVPFGISVDLFEHDSFLGRTESHSGPMWLDEYQSMSCINLDDDLTADRVTSLRVYKNRLLGPAAGYWIPVSHSEDIEISYTIGFHVGYEHTTKETE